MRRIGVAMLGLVVACGGEGHGYLAKNPGVPPIEVPTKIAGTCAVDLGLMDDEWRCAEPKGPFDLCVANLRTAFTGVLSDVGRKICAGGELEHPYRLTLRIDGLTREREDRPPSGLGAVVATSDATEAFQVFTLALHFELVAPDGHAIVARDLVEKGGTSGLSFDPIAARLIEDAAKDIASAVTARGANGFD